MSNIEKKIMTNVMLGVSIIVGFIAAETVYNAGAAGYMKLFHKDLWDNAVDELCKGDLA